MVRHIGRSGKHKKPRPTSHRGKSAWAAWPKRRLTKVKEEAKEEFGEAMSQLYVTVAVKEALAVKEGQDEKEEEEEDTETRDRRGAFIVKEEQEEEPQSEPLIPASIRRPWHVFGEDLDDKLADAQNQGCRVETLVADRFRSVQECGARTAFTHLPEDLQQAYAEVSMLELAAYVTWRRMHDKRASSFDGPIQFDTAWDALDCDEKVEWIPEDPRAVLLSDGKWAALLVAEDSASVPHSGVSSLCH